MGRNDSKRPTDAEIEVLNLLWQKGPTTVRGVHEALTKLRSIRYTTTLKTLQVMADKGLVTRDESQRAHVYEAAVGKEETQQDLVGDLIDRVFGGSAAGLVSRALSARQASDEELAEIRRLLEKEDDT